MTKEEYPVLRSAAVRFRWATTAVLALAVASAGLAAIKQGATAPDFALKDALKGNTYKLKDYRGRKVVLLDFGRFTCEPCRKVLGVMQKLEKRYAGKGVQFFSVNLDGPLTDRVVPKGIKDLKITFPVLPDRDYAVAKSYGVETIPFLVLVDTKGVARLVHVGYQDGLEGKLTKLIDQYRPK